MNIYTKHGDRGTTSLANGMSVSKSDDRIELLGTIDELNSHIGLAKVLADASLKERLSHIQRNLMQIMAGVADPRNLDYRFTQDETSALEKEIDQIESSFPRAKEFVLYGGVRAFREAGRSARSGAALGEAFPEGRAELPARTPKRCST